MMNKNRIAENLMEATNSLRNVNERENRDATTEDQIRKINQAIDSYQNLMHRVNKLEISSQRPYSSPPAANREQMEDIYDMAFGKYLRKGIEPNKNTSLKQLDHEQEDSGYQVTKRMADSIKYGISDRSTIRKVAEIISVSRDSYDRVNLPNDIAAYWSMDEAEASAHSSISKSQIQVNELYAQPKATQQMLDDASVDIEEWLARELIETFCDAEENAFINGDGLGKPKGILNSLNAINQYRTREKNSIEADDIIKLYYKIHSKYAGNTHFIIGRDCAQAIRTMKDNNGRYIWQPSLQENSSETLLGSPVLTSLHMPSLKNEDKFVSGSKAVLFGDFSKGYQVIDRQDIRVLRDPFTQKPYIKFYTTKRVGGMVNKSDAICSLEIS